MPDHGLFSLAALEFRVYLSSQPRKLPNFCLSDLDLTLVPCISMLGKEMHLFSELIGFDHLLWRFLVLRSLLHQLAHPLP